MLLLNILNIFNLVGVHISLNSDRSEYQKENYRSKQITNVRKFKHKDSNHIKTVDKSEILYSGPYVNEEIVQNVRKDSNSFYTDTGQIKDYNNKEFRDVKTNSKQNINLNVKYNTNSDWYDITPLNQFNLYEITIVNKDKKLKVNSVQAVIDLMENKILVQNKEAVNNLDPGDNVMGDLVSRNTNKRAVLNVERNEIYNQYMEHKSHQENDEKINSNVKIQNFSHNEDTNGTIARVKSNIDSDQYESEIFNETSISDLKNSDQNVTKYLDEDVTDDVYEVANSHEKHCDTDDTEYESISYEDLYEILDCHNNSNPKKNMEKSKSNNIDKEVEELELDDFKRDFVLEEEKVRPIIPIIKFIKKNNATVYMDLEWSPLVRQEKRISKSYKRKGKRKPTAWERYYSNYHENIGIPSAEKIKTDELSGDKWRLRSSTRIVNGVAAELGQFPYLVRFIL